MRLLYLNHNCRYYGTYYRAMPMAVRMAQRGHDVTLMTVSPTRRWQMTKSRCDGVHLIETPNLGQNYSGEGYGPIDNLVRIAHGLAHRYDVIHMFDHKPNATLGGLAARLHGPVLISDWADWWGGNGGINDTPWRRYPTVGLIENWWEDKIKLRSDGVISISRVLENRAVKLGIASQALICIPTGAALDRIRPEDQPAARASLDIPSDRKLLGFIGIGQGDLEIVMDVLRQLPEVGFMLIGPRNPKTYALAKSYGVEERLRQTDRIPDEEVSRYLACADVMCLPMTDRLANWGRLPNKFLDYLASGRPVVASPIGDIKTIMEEHEVGILAGESEFPAAIRCLLENRELWKRCATNARRTAETVFNWDTLSEQLERFYVRIVERKHGEGSVV